MCVCFYLCSKFHCLHIQQHTHRLPLSPLVLLNSCSRGQTVKRLYWSWKQESFNVQTQTNNEYILLRSTVCVSKSVLHLTYLIPLCYKVPLKHTCVSMFICFHEHTQLCLFWLSPTYNFLLMEILNRVSNVDWNSRQTNALFPSVWAMFVKTVSSCFRKLLMLFKKWNHIQYLWDVFKDFGLQ